MCNTKNVRRSPFPRGSSFYLGKWESRVPIFMGSPKFYDTSSTCKRAIEVQNKSLGQLSKFGTISQDMYRVKISNLGHILYFNINCNLSSKN